MNPGAGLQAVAIVPVRLDSQRLPGKALLAESGQPLFLHTCQQAAASSVLQAVYVATDSRAVARAAEAAGFPVLHTSDRPRTGSERCAEAAESLDAGVVLDIQGDWPEVEPDDLDRMAQALLGSEATCNTLAIALDDEDACADPNVVKVVRGLNGHALYFSRSPVPYRRKGNYQVWRHIGVYGFTRDVLLRISDLPSSGLAETEGLEQLRFLENGIPIQVLDGSGAPRGIETRKDYDAFLGRLATRGERGITNSTS